MHVHANPLPKSNSSIIGNRAPGSRHRRSVSCLSKNERLRRSRTKRIIHIRIEISFPENSRTFYFKESAAQNSKESKGRPRRHARSSRVGGHIRHSTRWRWARRNRVPIRSSPGSRWGACGRWRPPSPGDAACRSSRWRRWSPGARSPSLEGWSRTTARSRRLS